LSRSVIFNVGRDIEYDIRNDLFGHLEKLPLAYYQQHKTGDLMSRLVNDVSAVRMLLGPGILNFINTPVAGDANGTPKVDKSSASNRPVRGVSLETGGGGL